MKKIISFLLALMLLGSLGITAFAAESGDALLPYVTDDSQILTEEESTMLEEAARTISEKYQCGVYIATVPDYTAIGSGEVMDVAEAIYDKYLLGLGEEKDGVLLLISTDTGSVGMVSQGLAQDALDGQTQLVLDTAVDAYGNGGYIAIMTTYLAQMDALLGVQHLTEIPAETVSSDPAVLQMDGYVTDLVGILETEKEQELEAAAKAVSETYNRGVYIIILHDFTQHGEGDLYTTAGDIYLANDMGLGDKNDGILLLMSMQTRKVALISHDGSEQFFTADGKDWLAEKYLPNFRRDEWAEGLSEYVEGCDTVLKMAAKGRPMTKYTTPEAWLGGILPSLGIGWLIAWLITAILEGNMKSVHQATNAEGYIVQGGVKMTGKSDVFVRRTTSRRKIVKKSSSGGGGNASGGSRDTDSRGFSGRTDSF